MSPNLCGSRDMYCICSSLCTGTKAERSRDKSYAWNSNHGPGHAAIIAN